MFVPSLPPKLFAFGQQSTGHGAGDGCGLPTFKQWSYARTVRLLPEWSRASLQLHGASATRLRLHTDRGDWALAHGVGV